MLKKSGTAIIAVLFGLFAAFSAGFFVGRNLTDTPIQVSTIPQVSAGETTDVSESTGAAQTEAPVQAASGLININTADQQTLMLLPGIGEVLSQRIIDYRTEHGAFSHVTELLNVEGIGEKRMEQILPYATTGG